MTAVNMGLTMRRMYLFTTDMYTMLLTFLGGKVRVPLQYKDFFTRPIVN